MFRPELESDFEAMSKICIFGVFQHKQESANGFSLFPSCPSVHKWG